MIKANFNTVTDALYTNKWNLRTAPLGFTLVNRNNFDETVSVDCYSSKIILNYSAEKQSIRAPLTVKQYLTVLQFAQLSAVVKR